MKCIRLVEQKPFAEFYKQIKKYWISQNMGHDYVTYIYFLKDTARG